MKKIISIFIIQIISWQMAFGYTISNLRLPASSFLSEAQTKKFLPKLHQRFDNLYKDVKGYEDNSLCVQDPIRKGSSLDTELGDESAVDELSEFELMEQFLNMEQEKITKQREENTLESYLANMEELKTNACIFSAKPEGSNESEDDTGNEKESCGPQKIQGSFAEVSAYIVKREKQEEEVDGRVITSKITRVFYRVNRNKEMTQVLLDSDYVTLEEKKKLLLRYLETSLMLARDMFVVSKEYLSENLKSRLESNLKSLFVSFDNSLLTSENFMREKIKVGVNPTTEPFGLKIIEDGDRVTLDFDAHSIIGRDIITLMSSPTKKNFVQSLRLMTIQMMIGQKFTYQTILGNQDPIKLPNSCSPHLGFDKQEQIVFNLKNSDGENNSSQELESGEAETERVSKDEAILMQLLFNHGLTYDPANIRENDMYFYYMESLEIDPTKQGTYRILPFEKFKIAQANRFINNTRDIGIWDKIKGISDQDRFLSKVGTSLDDKVYFDKSMNILREKANAIFTKEQTIGNRHSGKRKQILRYEEELEVLDSILSFPNDSVLYEIEVGINDNGEPEYQTIAPEEKGYNYFLADSLQRHKTIDIEEIIPEEVKKELKQNRINLKLPKLFSSSTTRNWALQQLLSKLVEIIESEDENVKKLAQNKIWTACRLEKGGTAKTYPMHIRNLCTTNKLAEKLTKVVSQESEVIPLSKIGESELLPIYPLLQKVWSEFNKNIETKVVDSNEYDFLKDQIIQNNKWASIRLSFILLQFELEAISQGFKPTYKTLHRNKRTLDRNSKCFNSNIVGRKERFIEASKILAMDKPLSFSILDDSLGATLKDMLFEEDISEINQNTGSLFSTIDSREIPIYEEIENVSYHHLFTGPRLDRYLREKYPYQLHPKTMRDIEKFKENETLIRLGSFFDDIYKAGKRTEDISEKYKDMLSATGFDQNINIKSNFLYVDTKFKEIIYKDIIRKSAELRIKNIDNDLETFCNLDVNNEQDFKKIFFTTTKKQNELNKMTGVPTIPEDLLKRTQEYALSEKGILVDIALGVGAFVLAIGAKALGGACIFLSGGACLPVGLAMIGLGSTALAMQGALIRREYNRWSHAKSLSEMTERFERLGFATYGSNKDLNKSKGWFYFETLMLLPLIGIVGQTFKAGNRLRKVSKASLLTNNGVKDEVFKQQIKTTLGGLDDDMAKVVLKFNTFESQFGSSVNIATGVGTVFKSPALVLRSVRKKIRAIRILHQQGKLSLREAIAQISKTVDDTVRSITASGRQAKIAQATKITIESINNRTASIGASYFNNNASQFLKLLKSYTSKWSFNPRLKNKLVYSRAVNQKAKAGKFMNGTNWFYKLRYGHLADQSRNMNTLIRKLEASIANGQNLEVFIKENLDELTELFIRIPMRKRDLPYVALLQGGPHTGGIINGRRMSGVSVLGEGILMRKLFNARARLVYNTHREKSKEVLGYLAATGSEKSKDVFKSFQNSVNIAAHHAPEQEAIELLNKLDNFRHFVADQLTSVGVINEELVGKFIKEMKYQINIGDTDQLARLLFYPKSLKEKAVGDALWEQIPIERLITNQNLDDISSRALTQLANYENVDEFQMYLNALQVELLQKNPGLVEIF